LPRVRGLDQLRDGARRVGEHLEPGNGIIGRARSNPRLVVGIATAALLLIAWIGWAVYVTSRNGATAGLGVVVSLPALLAAVCLVSAPVVGAVLLVRRLSAGGETEDAPAESPEADEEDEEDQEEEEEQEDEDNGDEEDDGDEETGT
jgi:hypothetical protein